MLRSYIRFLLRTRVYKSTSEINYIRNSKNYILNMFQILVVLKLIIFDNMIDYYSSHDTSNICFKL